ncbi:MAG: AraC family transcriptional regulator [Spirochaetes bacterium]|nr:AraC family transcriptional regulator [Spirochaetota bacterium]
MTEFAVSDTIEALNGGLFVSPGFGIHAERVIDSYELIFVTQSRLDLFEGDRTFHLEGSKTLLLYPGVRHGGLLPYTADVNFYWVHFRLRAPASSDTTFGVPKVASIRDPEGLTELFCRFISDQESGILDRCSASQLIALMLCMVGRGTKQERPAPGHGTSRAGRSTLVDAVQRYISAEYCKPISTSVIARALRYNPDYLERVFSTQEGVSIVDAIHQKRISVARASLHHDVRRNINEIGYECGYSDAGYFRRMFKGLTGLTPREFRSLYARTHINTH